MKVMHNAEWDHKPAPQDDLRVAVDQDRRSTPVRPDEESLARLRQSAEWSRIHEALRSKLMRDPEVHRLEPTPRSALRDEPLGR
jgi:hypothetical protein